MGVKSVDITLSVCYNKAVLVKRLPYAKREIVKLRPFYWVPRIAWQGFTAWYPIKRFFMSHFDPTDHETTRKLQNREWIETNRGLIKTMREIIKNPKTPQANKDLAQSLITKYVDEIKVIEGGGSVHT